ncbi:major facilitator superfamily domain-containing protein [Aspergillus californicus]
MEKEIQSPNVLMAEGNLFTEPNLEKAQTNREVEAMEWTAQEERAVRWKLDLYLMPLLVIGFFVLQLDRSNISNALTDTITEDLHITSDQVSAGSQIMAAGVVVAEIPSNILQRFGASVWLTGLIAVWGTISLTQAFVTNINSFYATRFLLGLSEGGYIPGAQYLLALFYKPDELAMRTAIFYFGNYFATATGSLIAAGILQMAGIHELGGWRWLFIIEGSITLAIFLLFVLLLPSSPAHTKPVHRAFDVFTAREKAIMQSRVVLRDPSKGVAKARLGWTEFLDAISDIRIWLHGLQNILSLSPKGGLQLYGPSIIKSLGFTKTKANLLNSVSSYPVIIFSFIISFCSDKTGLRGPYCIVAYVWSIAFAGALLAIGINSDKWLRYTIFTLLGSGNALAQGLNDSWINTNAMSPHKRSMGLAFVTIGSNIGSIIGPSLFQSSDAPRYVNGLAAILTLYSGSILVTGIIMAVYWRDNKTMSKKQEDSELAPREYRYFQI